MRTEVRRRRPGPARGRWSPRAPNVAVMPRLHASFRYRDARAAIDWLERAFGFERVAVHDGEDGTVAHAELRLGDTIVMVSTEDDEPDLRWGRRAGTGWVYVGVDDADEAFERATAA